MLYDIKIKVDLENPQANGNLALKLGDNERHQIGQYVHKHIEDDIQSRSPWMESYSSWLRLAAQIKEEKSFPWPKASNVKYPLVTIASTQFGSRALPNIINSGQPVKVKVFGEDEDGQKQLRADRVMKHMSWQLLWQMEDWHDDTDRMLHILPISGLCHRKTFYSELLKRPESRLILPQNLVMNYHASTSKNQRRTELRYLTENQVVSEERREIILEVQSRSPSKQTDEVAETANLIKGHEEVGEEENLYEIRECHWELDLDGDGYAEPYIITLNGEDGQLLSIYPRWGRGAVSRNPAGAVYQIKGDEHYVDYKFLPDPSSATHGVGFGHLLGPLNESTNTLINQLIDAGTLATLQGGFFARNVRIPGGKLRFKPGEWRQVPVAGGDLRNGIFPLPVKEPSTALFNLLQFLIQAGERIASISDIMLGENPGQNQPASTTMAVLEQGLKVFTGIFGRIHRSMGKEYRQLYKINREFADIQTEAKLLDNVDPEELAGDYEEENIDIQVASDPSLVTDAQKILKAQSLIEKVPLGANPQFALQKSLEAEGYTKDEIQSAMEPSPPPIDPELELKMQQFQVEADMESRKADREDLKVEADMMEAQANSVLAFAKAQELGARVDLDKLQMVIDGMFNEAELRLKEKEASYGALESMAGIKKTLEEAKHVGDKPAPSSSSKE